MSSNRNRQMFPSAPNVQTGAGSIAVRAIFGNVFHSIGASDREVMERCLLPHRPRPGLLGSLPVEFGMILWLRHRSRREIFVSCHTRGKDASSPGRKTPLRPGITGPSKGE